MGSFIYLQQTRNYPRYYPRPDPPTARHPLRARPHHYGDPYHPHYGDPYHSCTAPSPSHDASHDNARTYSHPQPIPTRTGNARPHASSEPTQPACLPPTPPAYHTRLLPYHSSIHQPSHNLIQQQLPTTTTAHTIHPAPSPVNPEIAGFPRRGLGGVLYPQPRAGPTGCARGPRSPGRAPDVDLAR